LTWFYSFLCWFSKDTLSWSCWSWFDFSRSSFRALKSRSLFLFKSLSRFSFSVAHDLVMSFFISAWSFWHLRISSVLILLIESLFYSVDLSRLDLFYLFISVTSSSSFLSWSFSSYYLRLFFSLSQFLSIDFCYPSIL